MRKAPGKEGCAYPAESKIKNGEQRVLNGEMRMRTLRCAAATLVVLPLLLASLASADPDSNHSTSGLTSPTLLGIITNDDVFSTADLSILLAPPGSNATQHYGPYPSMSPDSGTCGNDWATDTFDRHFTVKSNQDGTFTVIEQFKNGDFTTMQGASPGACQPTPTNGFVADGVVGSMHGYFIISNVGTQTSFSPYCDAASMSNSNCTTMTFIDTHFNPCYPSVCTVTTFFFHYSAGDQQLVEHEWKNASPDRGGNHGDIRSPN
jgi:hypothetical protein